MCVCALLEEIERDRAGKKPFIMPSEMVIQMKKFHMPLTTSSAKRVGVSEKCSLHYYLYNSSRVLMYISHARECELCLDG